ncbi:MAG TPA: hypothetical protein VMM78_11860 [Thermomicrobiales bacterium]|nr:hypothetical protein [Thermomicrobiales bacterium]
MDKAATDNAFHVMVTRYEGDGWVVRTIDSDHSRAIVRAAGETPTCRKLWVDAAGSVHETDVPC